MEIIEVNKTEYQNMIPNPFHVYGKAEHADLNIDKVDKIYYLLFKDSKYRLGLIAGIKDNNLISPFSAPFGGFSYINNDIKIQQIDEAVDVLIEWAKFKLINNIKIVLPPIVYDDKFIAKCQNVFYRKGFIIDSLDLNYAYNLLKFNDDYQQNLVSNARKNLNIGINKNLTVKKCAIIDDFQLAYQIIKINRESKGYPLRMTYEQVENTQRIVKIDFLICYYEKKEIASAIVFHVSKDIVQVVYWGDLMEYNHFKTMNFFSYYLFDFYKKLGYKCFDIGPSTENSIPNYGLCEFKESIGCDISNKITFVLNLK